MNGQFTQGEVEQAFNSFDLDGNSFIGAAELRQVYSALGDDVTDEEVQWFTVHLHDSLQ